jgi:GNAT superfamily N-acetyltransferase
LAFSITCRVADHGDITAMSEIRLSVAENILTDPARVTLADYVAYLNDQGQSWVVEADGRILAFGAANRSGLIWALFVRPGFEGRGLGRLALEECLAWLERGKAGRAFLDTGAGTRAEGFYRSQGWREINRESERVNFELPLPRAKSDLRPGRRASGA